MTSAPAEEKPRDRRRVSPALRPRPNDQLIQRVLAVVEVAVGDAVAVGDVRRGEHFLSDDRLVQVADDFAQRGERRIDEGGAALIRPSAAKTRGDEVNEDGGDGVSFRRDAVGDRVRLVDLESGTLQLEFSPLPEVATGHPRAVEASATERGDAQPTSESEEGS